MLKKTLAILLTILTLLSLGACSLLGGDTTAESEAAVTTDTFVDATVATTVDTTIIYSDDVEISYERIVSEVPCITADSAENTNISDVFDKNFGTDEHTKPLHTDLKPDTIIAAEEYTSVIEIDIWDGIVADGFAGGDGTEKSPYQISKASQLAFLAKSVNEGNMYTDNYFVLVCDINLNNIEWTPIGNIDFPFDGYFDGNGHTVKNLKITETIKYISTYSHTVLNEGIAGLFGVCRNANIYNFNIENANISTNNTNEFDQLRIGILVGSTYPTNNLKISDIKIYNSLISTHKSDSKIFNLGVDAMYLGGLVGYVNITEVAQCEIKRVQCEVVIDCSEGFRNVNNIGGCIGYIGNNGVFECSDFANYLTSFLPNKQADNYLGAFGHISNIAGVTKLTNAFSEIKTNTPSVTLDGYYSYNKSAICGGVSQARNQDGSYEFQNLFGYVKLTEENDGFTDLIFSLYDIPEHIKLQETNCFACEVLPQDHNFDNDVWDLGDNRAPILK